MIMEAILNAFLSIPDIIIGLIPHMDITIPDNALNSIGDIFYGIAYLFPLKELMPLAIIDITCLLAELTLKIIWRVKSFIPTMGK